MLRFVPPAGIPISVFDMMRALGLKRRGSSYAEDLTDDVRMPAGVLYADHFSSGRAALTVILESLAELSGPGKDEVVIPAYTCFSVAAAVARAGLRIRLCDVNPRTLDYDYDELCEMDLSHVVAVIACSLFGLLCNWERLSRLGEQNGVFLVDDAAQSFGISDGDRPAGTMGDVGFISLGRGKPLTACSGGIAVTSNELIGGKVRMKAADLRRPSRADDIKAMAKTAAYGLFLNPRLYWIPNSLPFLGLGETLYDPSFPMRRLGGFQGRIGRIMLEKMPDITAIRVQNSQRLISTLGTAGNVMIPGAFRKPAVPYLRLPVLMASRAARDTVSDALRKRGIGAPAMYPHPIDQIPGIAEHLVSGDRGYPGAREVAARLLTLPTHPYVSGRDIAVIADTFRAHSRSNGDQVGEIPG